MISRNDHSSETMAAIDCDQIKDPHLENCVASSQLNLSQDVTNHQISQLSYYECLSLLERARTQIQQHPYALHLYVGVAQQYLHLAYPDLAAGAAYKALLLSDAVQDDGDEFHQRAVDSLVFMASELREGEPSCETRTESGSSCCDCHDDVNSSAAQRWLTDRCLPIIYETLAYSLALCGCFKSAMTYCLQGRALYPENDELHLRQNDIRERFARHLGVGADALLLGEFKNPSDWPDQGFVRREQYPWNNFNPDRLRDLETLNGMMSEVAPKLEVAAIELPVLEAFQKNKHLNVVRQLGVFAKDDIVPGEIVLDEKTILTANNRLEDALCDACSADLPSLDSPEASNTLSCADCEIVFCGADCYNQAMLLYHPALCSMDVEAIGKDVLPAQAADALYARLLLRTLAMAETQQLHPLELRDVKYIWGDFHNERIEDHWRSQEYGSIGNSTLPKTLPFSFEYNIRLPFQMLEKMDINIFSNHQYDIWVFNTLYAKFRGTASARLSGARGGPIRGPEVSAVHPMWCLANHSCDPNVSWDWSGNIKFRAREERVRWRNRDDQLVKKSPRGIKKGEEVLNHYCDIDLAVDLRREWAMGALGGICRCSRCLWEADEAELSSSMDRLCLNETGFA